MKKMKCVLSLVLCLLMLITSVLTGCSEPTPGETENLAPDADELVVIRFWNGFTGKDGEAMDRIVEKFNAELGEQYNVKVVADKIPWDTLFTKITTTSSNLRSAPHIVAMSASRISSMQARGILTPLTGIEDYLNVTADEYIDVAWEGGVLEDGTRYGFPIDVHPTAMYYNKNLISEEELPKTWDEFFSICEKKTTGGVYGWAIPSMYSVTKDVFLNLLYSNGGSVLDKKNNVVYNSPEGVAALERMYDGIYGSNPISPKNVGAGGDQTLFVQGKSAFYFDGPWVLNSFGLLDNPDSNIGVARCPSVTGEPEKNFAGSHQFTLMANTVTDDRTRELCYVFMRYVNENSFEWALGGQVPALKTIHETEEYKALAALQPFTEMANEATLGDISYVYWYECYNMMGVAVSNALSDQASAKDALDSGAKEFSDWLADEAAI